MTNVLVVMIMIHRKYNIFAQINENKFSSAIRLYYAACLLINNRSIQRTDINLKELLMTVVERKSGLIEISVFDIKF